ncbi:patatin-like phospholipase family protein [bacterium]|nr:patatin-like phospholipase family protein [bacterium]
MVSQTEKPKTEKPKVGLALGGGGPKGLAHIGIIKVLEENNIPIDFIAGTSIGALIGGFYALTKDVDKMEKIALGMGWRKMLSLLAAPSFSLGGFVKAGHIEKFFREQFGQKTFDDLKIPFVAVATDLNTGREVRIKDGYLIKAVAASISLPVIFAPVKLQNSILADGGLVNPVPDNVVREMGADIVVAVNLLGDYLPQSYSKNKRKWPFFRLLSVIDKSGGILQARLAHHYLKEADVVIVPKLSDISWMRFSDFTKAKSVIERGELSARAALGKIKNLL